MVEYKLIDIDEEGCLVYEYWIDRDSARKGLAVLDPQTGKAHVSQRVEGSVNWHEGHLLADLRRKWKPGEMQPEHGLVIWY